MELDWKEQLSTLILKYSKKHFYFPFLALSQRLHGKGREEEGEGEGRGKGKEKGHTLTLQLPKKIN